MKGRCHQEHQILQKTRRKREGGARGIGEGAGVGGSEGLGEEPEEKGGAIGKGEEPEDKERGQRIRGGARGQGEEPDERGKGQMNGGGARGKGRSQRKRSQRGRRRSKKDVGSQAWKNWHISI